MKLLAIDPSSTCTGYAFMTCGDGPGRVDLPVLIEHGRIRHPSAGPLRRIDATITDLLDLSLEHRPDRVIIEVPSGKVAGRIAKRSRGAGLTIYGMAAGAIRQAFRDLDGTGGDHVFAIEEATWITQANQKKSSRQAAAHALYPVYDPTTDRGGDAADAIMLGVWWAERRDDFYVSPLQSDSPLRH